LWGGQRAGAGLAARGSAASRAAGTAGANFRLRPVRKRRLDSRFPVSATPSRDLGSSEWLAALSQRSSGDGAPAFRSRSARTSNRSWFKRRHLSGPPRASTAPEEARRRSMGSCDMLEHQRPPMPGWRCLLAVVHALHAGRPPLLATAAYAGDEQRRPVGHPDGVTIVHSEFLGSRLRCRGRGHSRQPYWRRSATATRRR
jgi:hypothetical protein